MMTMLQYAAHSLGRALASKNMVWMKALIAAGAAASLTACVSTRDVAGACGTAANQDVCTGTMTVPDNKVADFQEAARLTIDVISSD